MVRRLLADSAGLQVSMPGIDVLAATPSQMILDTRSNYYLALFSSGQINFSSFSQTNAYTVGVQSYEVWQYTVQFGQSFPNPPVILAAVQNFKVSGSPSISYWNDGETVTTGSSTSGYTTTGGGCLLGWSVSTTGVTFTYLLTHNTFWVQPPATLSYAICFQS